LSSAPVSSRPMHSGHGDGEQELVECELCFTFRRFGHLDPDNLQWYCEECWQSFTGNERSCALCGAFSDEGRVDYADKRWYCHGCWGSYHTAKVPAVPLPKPLEATPPEPGKVLDSWRATDEHRSAARPSTAPGIVAAGGAATPSRGEACPQRLATDSWRAAPAAPEVLPARRESRRAGASKSRRRRRK
ncbi:unnamed protein product, partial [Polarella glacialis]